jgi:hypothetical protein
MTKDDIIRMAREAGFERTKMHNALEQFAYIVAAAEREACASLCFQMWNEWMDNEYISELNRPDAEDCAHAIRKRGLHNLNKEAEKNGEEL